LDGEHGDVVVQVAAREREQVIMEALDEPRRVVLGRPTRSACG
jgi:hypothetical protein